MVLAWMRFCPRQLTRRQLLAAQTTFMRRARAAGITSGPGDEPVGSDELGPRRRQHRKPA